MARMLRIRPILGKGKQVLLSLFPQLEQLGIHVTPVHYYQPIPDTRTLGDDLWRSRSRLGGIRMNPDAQIELLHSFSQQFRAEYDQLAGASGLPHEFCFGNGSFEAVDAEVLYCMIRSLKPRRIFEIGSGNTTYVAAKAALKNTAEGAGECEIVAYEPYPNPVLRQGFPGLTRLVQQPVQSVPVEEFQRLEENDILFIDSTHVLKIGSDVQYEYLEILPSLNRGVVVHIHDIFLPAEYPKHWVLKNRWFWNEQYLLQAFLAFNDSFRIVWAASYMHLLHSAELAAAFDSYDGLKTWPGSFWIQKTS